VCSSDLEDSGVTGCLCDFIQNPGDAKSKKLCMHYLYILGLAHSCQYDEIEGVYKSASPDEEALCRAAKKNGFEFKGRERNRIKLTVFGEEEPHELLIENEFTSHRRRMSVIVRTPGGKIYLYIKGADSVIKDRLKDSRANKIRLSKILEDLEEVSLEGLRTLLLAYKEITEEEFQAHWIEYNQANNLIDNREEELERVRSKVEQNLILVGGTAIEDSLQDGVPETIFNLRKAGIKVWVITGDKQETAINIGYSSNLLSEETTIVTLNAESEDTTEQVLTQGWKTVNEGKPFSLVVDGQTLVYILSNHRESFLRLAALCETAICNRVTPLQKAEIVALVQSGLKVICLSIGDGGNDVSMIQQAEIGVGIKGREGSQAARSADYAIPKFRHLEKLLFVHGRYALLRNTKVIYQSFYKNSTIFLVIVWYSFWNGASGLAIYADWTMTIYNVILTSLPVFAIGIFEKDLPEEIIHQHPEIYKLHKQPNFWSFVRWFSDAIFHSLLIFWFCWALFYLSEEVVSGPHSLGYRILSSFIITVGFHVVMFKLMLETNHWVPATVIVFILSFLAFYLWGIFESYLIIEYLGVFVYLLSTPILWLSILWIIPSSMLLEVTLKYIYRQSFPKPWHIFQEKFLSNTNDNIIEMPDHV